MPEQAPLQPVKTEVVGSAAAARFTVSPLLSEVLVHGLGDVTPAAMLQLTLPLTLPLPAPDPVTVRVVRLKMAVTDLAVSRVTLQAVPVQAPLHWAKADPGTLVVFRATEVPCGKEKLQGGSTPAV